MWCSMPHHCYHDYDVFPLNRILMVICAYAGMLHRMMLRFGFRAPKVPHGNNQKKLGISRETKMNREREKRKRFLSGLSFFLCWTSIMIEIENIIIICEWGNRIRPNELDYWIRWSSFFLFHSNQAHDGCFDTRINSLIFDCFQYLINENSWNKKARKQIFFGHFWISNEFYLLLRCCTLYSWYRTTPISFLTHPFQPIYRSVHYPVLFGFCCTFVVVICLFSFSRSPNEIVKLATASKSH